MFSVNENMTNKKFEFEFAMCYMQSGRWEIQVGVKE